MRRSYLVSLALAPVFIVVLGAEAEECDNDHYADPNCTVFLGPEYSEDRCDECLHQELGFPRLWPEYPHPEMPPLCECEAVFICGPAPFTYRVQGSGATYTDVETAVANACHGVAYDYAPATGEFIRYESQDWEITNQMINEMRQCIEDSI